MCKVPSCEGTDCAGGFSAGVSWAHDVPAHASTIGRAVPAKIRKRVRVFTVEHEAYHCFFLFWFRLMPHANARGSLRRRFFQLQGIAKIGFVGRGFSRDIQESDKLGL